MDEQVFIFNTPIEFDASGVGHCWKPAMMIDCPLSIQEEIEGEMMDGGQALCVAFVASNGVRYRW